MRLPASLAVLALLTMAAPVRAETLKVTFYTLPVANVFISQSDDAVSWSPYRQLGRSDTPLDVVPRKPHYRFMFELDGYNTIVRPTRLMTLT